MDLYKPKLLLVDDDLTFCKVLSTALSRRNFNVTTAHDGERAIALAEEDSPAYAVVDLKMPGQSGLFVVEQLCERNPQIRVVVLTGYASIATAIAAIKLGAIHYLAKPVDADEIIEALHMENANTDKSLLDEPMSVDRLEWEHIQKVLFRNNGNISATARELKMHRRTLQRKLNKHPAKQ